MSRALRRPDHQQPRAAAAGARARGRVRYLGHRQGPARPSRAGHHLTDPSKEPDPAKCQADMAYLTNHGNAHTALARGSDTGILLLPTSCRAAQLHITRRSGRGDPLHRHMAQLYLIGRDLKLFEPITMLRLSRYATAKSAVVHGLQGGRVSASACSAGPPWGDGGPTPPRRLAPSGSAMAKSEASAVPSGGSCANSPGRPSAHSRCLSSRRAQCPHRPRRAGRLLTASLLLPSQARQGSW